MGYGIMHSSSNKGLVQRRRNVLSDNSSEVRGSGLSLSEQNVEVKGGMDVGEGTIRQVAEENQGRVVILSDPGDEDSGISELGGEDHPVLIEKGEGRHPPAGKGGREEKPEPLCTLIIQIIIPFFFAGFGMMLAGLLLDAVQHWSVYEDITELFILIPSLLGLKGNLEMTLASRLSTAANVGQLDTWSQSWKLTWGNLSLIQVQALVVASLATVFSIILGADLTGFHQLLLGASAMGAASAASALLGTVMIGVIITSHYFRINPDNVATPIAASLGDLVTLGLLSLLAQSFYNLGKHNVPSYNLTDTVLSNTTAISPHPIIVSSSMVLAFLFILIPMATLLAYKNSTTRTVLFYGWIPVISAMIISSGGGWILSKAVSKWEGIAVYSPIINGVGGNLVAVQASRISTSLHRVSSPGKTAPQFSSYRYFDLYRIFIGSNVHARTTRVLLLISIPGSLIFLFVIDVLRAGHTTQSLLFYVGYLTSALLQVIILLVVVDWMVHFIWRCGYDPDNVIIPFMTALGDLLGTGLLSLAFLGMWYLGDRDADVGD